jgi:hypothetical protein
MRLASILAAVPLLFPAAASPQAPAPAPPAAVQQAAGSPQGYGVEATALLTGGAHAGTGTAAPVWFVADAASVQQADGGGMPAWLKWGLVGGVATAGLAALLSGASIDTDAPGAGEAAARGFVIGFATVGGGVAVYQLICSPRGWSRRNGLCDRAPRRRLH